jgi:tetratricopeptide (TPR) repeat protein
MSNPVVPRDAQVLRAFVERVDQTDPRAFNNLGVLYHSKGMHREAVDAFLRAIALDPRMQTAVRNLEVAALADGACETHLASLAERLVRDPDDRDAAREQGRLLRLIGRHTEAAQKLDALIAEDPDDAPALFERGLLEQRVGDLRKAQRWFERASNADELNVFSRLHLAEVLYQRGQNEQALAALDNLLLINDEVADAHLLRGFVLGDMGRHESGMEAARRATALNPAIASAQANLSLEKVLSSGAHPAVDPGVPPTGEPAVCPAANEPAHYNLGLAFRQRGYFAEARREFMRAVEKGEEPRGVKHAVAELDLIAGNSESAATAYAELFSQYGETARWRNEHGVAMHQTGALQEAAESYRRALRCDPRYALAYANLGVALADMNEAAAAREALQQAAAIDPTLVQARLNLARLHLLQRDPLAALSLLRELSTFHASHADVWYEMGQALVALHRPLDAQQAYSSAVEHRASHAMARQALQQLAGTNDENAEAVRSPVARTESRLSVGIELQHECPDATGEIELLAGKASAPGIDPQAVSAENAGDIAPADNTQTIGDLFGGASGVFASESDAIISVPAAPVVADSTLSEANAFAARAQHAQAFECYANVRAVAEWSGAQALWRQAALGESRSLCLLGRGAEAVDLLEKLLHEGSPGADDEAETLALLAAAHAAEWKDTSSEPRRARAAIARFMRLESRSAALLHFVGNVAVSLREEALALVLFRRALAVDPMRPTPRVAIARLLRLRNDLLPARLELVAALAVAPQLRDALLELARLNCVSDRASEALPVLVSMLGREPSDADALVLLAHALVQVGREKDARLAVARALRFRPQHAEALALAGALAESSSHQVTSS